MLKLGYIVLLAASGMVACHASPTAGTVNEAGGTTQSPDFSVPLAPTPSPTFQAGLRLSGPAAAGAIAAVEAEAARQKMAAVRIDRSQSFNVVDGGKTVATLVTGRGNLPDTTLNGCFVAMLQGHETMLIPTLGYGEYEAEPCGGPLAVGFLSSGAMPRLGIVFRSYSREAEQLIPIVVEWDRSNNTMLIDEDASRRALDAGATSISAMRKIAK